MNQLQQEVSRRQRRFGEESKRDAVRLVVEEGYTFKAAAAAISVVMNSGSDIDSATSVVPW